MATLVLVPGAWLGGWCWRRVTPWLTAQGHAVATPMLTALAERSHLASHKVDLETHIQDVVNMLIGDDLEDVVLVGHSYAGFVVAGVADRAPERIAELVFLDTSIPADGEAFLALCQRRSARRSNRPPHATGDGQCPTTLAKTPQIFRRRICAGSARRRRRTRSARSRNRSGSAIRRRHQFPVDIFVARRGGSNSRSTSSRTGMIPPGHSSISRVDTGL